MIYLHFISFVCAVIGYVYGQILTEPKMIFNKAYIYLESKLPDWLFYPIIGCYRCITGQIALWVFGYLFIKNYLLFDFNSLKTLFFHAYYISLSILISCLINRLKPLI